MMLCMPRMAACGGLTIGVDIIEPKVPPLVMVKVPPVISSIDSLPSRAFLPKVAMPPSISARLISSALRRTGTTRPRSLETATPTSA
ncbi:hypothetical protein D3C86_1712490 [compost metagenome]